jgi:hypothetical protein
MCLRVRTAVQALELSNHSAKDAMIEQQRAVATSLTRFKSRRDDALHEDESAFFTHLKRLLELVDGDSLIQSTLTSIRPAAPEESETWWNDTMRGEEIAFPNDADAEFAFRWRLLLDAIENPTRVRHLAMYRGKKGQEDQINYFRSLVLRPWAQELTHKLSDHVGYPSAEARALQGVPLARIPSDGETRIFLSHKSVDKPLVYRFHRALEACGFRPWLDEPEMPAGTNLERGVYQGFQESCAAVFFITENFKDEKYLAAEVDYAVQQKRQKEKKFAIVTLRFEGSAPVPGLLTPYIYKDVRNDLDAFRELVRALPIELGPLRWKAGVVS